MGLKRLKIQVVVVVVTGDVARLLRTIQFHLEFRDHAGLNHFAAAGIDRVGDIGVQFGASFVVADGAIFFQTAAALVAMGRAQMNLLAALRTMRGELAAGHGHERAVGSIDNFQIADNKRIVKGNRTESL